MASSNRDQLRQHDDELTRFARDNVRISPEQLASLGKDDSTPDRETMTQADLMASTAPRPQSSVADEVNGAACPHLVALVRAGATFINGKLVERPGEKAQEDAA